MSDGDDDHDLVESALDLFVYAPLGLALEARELLPKLAERGRGQVALARVMGRFALRRGQNEATKFVDAAVSGFREGVTPSSGPRSDTTEVPIDDYDNLTAASIVSALGDLDPDQLRTVASYERAGRNRITVLNRVDQLLP
ncbi:MAG: hypothetical protein ACR2QE_15235 [Acidimicrobiales bacterium]